MKVRALFLVILTLNGAHCENFTSLANSSNWENYLRCLSFFQKYSPSSYYPPELIRFDRLPFNELAQQVEKFSKSWLSTIKSRKASKDIHYQKLNVSKEANWELYLLLKNNADRASMYGSRRDLLDKFPKEARSAMTPLDDSFKLNTFSKELSKTLEKGGISSWNAFSFDPQEKSLQLEIAPNLSQARISYPIASITLKDKSNVSNTFKVRTPASQMSGIPDLRVDPTYLQGNFFNSKSNDYTPFGKFINSNDTFIDEKGQSHFSGDGHNHKH